MTFEERIAHLEAENSALHEQMQVLLVRVQTLEARLAKDSHNSSKPPSSNGLRRRTKSLRTPSGMRPGGQLGHRGETLRLVAEPDAVVEHRPAVCAGCQTPLHAAAPVVLRDRRQVQDLPPLRLLITEHQALHVRCLARQAVSGGAFPPEAPSRAQGRNMGRSCARWWCIWWRNNWCPTRGCRRWCATCWGWRWRAAR